MDIDTLTAHEPVSQAVRHFHHTPGTQVHFGPGCLTKLGALARSLGARRALVVTDPGVASAGHSGRAVDALESQAIMAPIFRDVKENPTSDDVARCVYAADMFGVDLLVAIGGGSSLDTAKGANFLLTNGGEIKDYWGVDKAKKEMLPMIAIPTTAGTGSECQSFALIADAVTHMKMACGDKKAAARHAILDPDLTLTQPKTVTVCTGIDAITHALETAVTRKQNDISFQYSKLAFSLLNRAFESVLTAPDDLVSRAQMQLGAAYAGTAIENSMLGAAHSLANPLSAHFDIIHGRAVGIMMPHVIRYNSEIASIAEIYRDLGQGTDLAQRMEQLLSLSDIPPRLRDHGVTSDLLPTMAEEAAAQWTAQFNPREVDATDLLALYEAAW